MTVTINGTTGVSGVAGSASTPALIGSDADSGYYINSANEPNASVNGTAVWSAASTFGFKNRIINGAMMIDQRNAGASVTNSGSNIYALDRWFCSGISAGTYTVQQVADAPAGFTYSLKISTGTTTTAADVAPINQRIEANNMADLNWGTSNGQPLTFSFWVKANNTGTYNANVIFYGGTSTYYYLMPYTISSANTWTQITITIPAPPAGAGAYAGAMTSSYLIISPVIYTSSGWTTYGTANTWQNASSNNNYKASAGAFNLGSTSSATFQFTGVQLEKGSTATSFDFRSYGTELALCQRYYYRNVGASGTAIYLETYAATGAFPLVRCAHPAVMRSAPTISTIGTFSTGGCTGVTAGSPSTIAVVFYATANAAAGRTYYLNDAASGYDATAEL